MTQDEIQDELVKYVQSLETNYSLKIKDLRTNINREKKNNKKVVTEVVNETQSKNELEGLFTDCVMIVRKDVMKRKLRSDIHLSKKQADFEKDSLEA